MNFLIRKLLSKGKIMNLVCFVRAFYFCKIIKVMKDYEKVTKDTWEKTLASNKRKIYDKNINQIKLNQYLFSKLTKLSVELPDIIKLNH